MAAHKDEFQAQLDTLAGIAAKSTSPATTSKWIAASDEKVKALVFKKFDGGRELTSVTSFPSSRRGEYAVVFAFERPDSPVNLVQESVLVTVDLLAKKVVDIIDPFVAEDTYSSGPSIAAARGTVPFAMRVPSNAPNVVVSREAGAAYRAAEREFFLRRGIEPDPFGPGRPGRPTRPGWFWPPDRPGFDLPERGGGLPSPAATYYYAQTPVATDIGTDTVTPGEMTDDVENDGHTDYQSDLVPHD